MPFIYSTLTNSNIFAVYKKSANAQSPHRILKRIEINGGHGMKNPKGIDTPMGVVTKVSDEDLAILEQNISFQRHVKNGYIVVDKKQTDPAKKAKDMNPKDGSAPLTPKDFEKSEVSTKETPIYKAPSAGLL